MEGRSITLDIMGELVTVRLGAGEATVDGHAVVKGKGIRALGASV